MTDPATGWLTTPRLALRRFSPADIDWLAALYADPEVMRYLGGARDRASAEALLYSRILGYYDEHPGFGIWITLERATGAPLGFHLLNRIRGESIIQIGFVLARAAWGRGVGTEMATALLRYGFTDLNLPRIAGMADLNNHASQHVLTKIGLERRGQRAFHHPDYVAAGAVAWFERDAAAWLAEHQATGDADRMERA
jgi:RimJ/RimL family protein N-acetyltransferase